MSDQLVGWLTTLTSCVLYGIMFLPIRPFDMKDGFFVQWVQAMGILFLGAVVHVATGLPDISPLAIAAGVIWATGNICTVPIINMLGGGLGFMIWGSVQIIVGWATGRFGWFGLSPEKPYNDAMQYSGVALTLASALMFVLVKQAEQAHQRAKIGATTEGNEQPNSEDNISISTVSTVIKRKTADDTNDAQKRKTESASTNGFVEKYMSKIFGVLLAVFAGFMFGENMTPVTYLIESGKGSPHGIDYSLSFTVGVALAATFYFVLYCLIMKNRPYVNFQVALPAFVYGLIWAGAQFSWFVAVENLSQSITFPIITRTKGFLQMPGIINSLFMIFVFREIRGLKNLLLFAGATLVALTGVILVGLSGEDL